MRKSVALTHQSQPSLSCVIASTPWSGSALLCSALAQTGIVGQPDEYIAFSVYKSLAAQWGYAPGNDTATTRVARAMQHTTTPNGAFALQAHWHDFAMLLRTIRSTADPAGLLDQVDQLLASPRYVHISWRDTSAHALSYYRAIYAGETDVRSDAPPDQGHGGPEPVLLGQVRWLEDMLIDWDARWEAYFASCDIRPLEVSYEDLVTNYRPTVERVLDYLGLESTPTVANLEAVYPTDPSEWTHRWLDEYRAGRDRLVPQPAEESWSRQDRFFEVTPSTEYPGSVGTGGANTSPSRFEDKVLYSCVVDKPPLLVYQSLVWVLTLTRLAGLAPEQLVVHVVEGTDPDHVAVLRSLGVHVVPVARFDQRNAYANKLRQLTAGALVDASTSVLSDCDIAFAGDITPFTRGAAVRGKTVGAGFPTVEAWSRLICAAGLTRELGLGRAAGQTLRWTCAQNLNGGLLVIPGPFHDQLAEAWPRWIGWVLDHGDEFADDGVNGFADQVSFGLALLELGLPIGRLPITANCSLGGDQTKLIETVYPLAVHYHRDLTSAGRLPEVGVPAMDVTVAKVNALLDEPASREVLEVALRNWQEGLEPSTPRRSRLKARWLSSPR